MRTQELVDFMVKRHSIYVMKSSGFEKPWTFDPILQRYKFCNVYRELDTVTQWLDIYWRKPYAAEPTLWFGMVVARFLNWPDTLFNLGYPAAGWTGNTRRHFYKVVAQRGHLNQKIYGGAYTISTNGRKMVKHKYLDEQVFTPLWEKRQRITDIFMNKKSTLAECHAILRGFQGLGSFMAAQVIADVKHVKTQPIARAKDWWTWAASGPGSRRGLNRVCKLPLNLAWKEAEWLKTLEVLHDVVSGMLTSHGTMKPIHAQDLQNCLCEFDKYERVRLGEGRPRSLYPGV